MKRKNILLDYFIKYKMNYIKIIIFFLVGIIFGVIVINTAGKLKIENLTEYVNELVENIKNKEEINYQNSLLLSISKNVKLMGILFILGSTVIGSFFIYLTVGYQGFKLGYTISTFLYVLGIKRGIIFSLSSLLLQNIILIPTIFVLSESGIRFCKETSKNRNNIKCELIRNFIIFIICICTAIVASFIEVYFSTKILNFFKEIL